MAVAKEARLSVRDRVLLLVRPGVTMTAGAVRRFVAAKTDARDGSVVSGINPKVLSVGPHVPL